MPEGDIDGLRVAVEQAGPIPLAATLNCAPGELLALVGPSGSGKSTILRTIAGLYRPLQGRIACNGNVWFDAALGINVAAHRRSVGLVFQSYALFPHLSVLGNVIAALGHRPHAERASRAQSLINTVHLAGLEHRRPSELSGGQQQRVAVARALARDPQVLLLDEPFSAVDKVTRQNLYRELADLRRNFRMPIVLVTHDFDEAARLADSMCLLHRGRLLQTGTPHEVLAHPINIEAARLVDLRNLFDAIVAEHRTENHTTIIQWDGRRLVTPYRPDLALGAPVAWAIPSTQVILQREDVLAPVPNANLVPGTVGELTMLSESTTVAVFVDGRADRALSMTVPEHFARRTGLAIGSPVTVSLLVGGIHLMAAPKDPSDKLNHAS